MADGTTEITIDGETLNIITKARMLDGDIQSFESRIRVLREQIQEELESTDEYTKVSELEGELKTAREALKRRLESNSHYMDLTSDLGNERDSLKSAKYNLSEFLLAYFAETRERQIELGPKQAREVIIKGRLGKPKEFQTSIFTPPPINTNEGRKDLE